MVMTEKLEFKDEKLNESEFNMNTKKNIQKIENEIEKSENFQDNDEEELSNYAFNEDQFKEFTYILIKNFEALKLDNNEIKIIFDEVDSNSDEIVLNELSLKIALCLNMYRNFLYLV